MLIDRCLCVCLCVLSSACLQLCFQHEIAFYQLRPTPSQCTSYSPTCPAVQSAKKRKKSGGADAAEDAEAAAASAPQSQALIAQSYTPPDPGPYPQDKPPENSVRFTPVQVRFATLLSTSVSAAVTTGSHHSGQGRLRLS